MFINILFTENYIVTDMTGRYSRKTVPFQVQGVSHDRMEVFIPRPERCEDPVPENYSYSYYPSSSQEASAISIKPTNSEQSSPVHTESACSPRSFSIGYLGNDTERSSIGSIMEDKLDKKASKQTRALFEEIDSMLFERNPGPSHLQQECHEWVSTYPHLRVLGKQSKASEESGFQIYAHERDPHKGGPVNNLLQDITEHDISTAHMAHELSISGQKMAILPFPQEVLGQHSDRVAPGFLSDLQEEIFEKDGEIEEVIAMDENSSVEEILSHERLIYEEKGLPPVEPHQSLRHAIVSTAFDFLWTGALDWLLPVLREYKSHVHSEPLERERRLSLIDLHSHYSPSSDFSRENTFTGSLRPERCLPNRNMSQQPEHLRDVLTISGLMVKAPLLQDSTEPAIPPPSPAGRAGRGRPGSVRKHESRIPQSAQRRKLNPLDRVRTPNIEEDHKTKTLLGAVIVGKGFGTSRNDPLPPISMDMTAEEHHFTRQRPIKGITRACSAVHHDSKDRFTYRDRERTAPILEMGRPSTTTALYSHFDPSPDRFFSTTPSKMRMLPLHQTLSLNRPNTPGSGPPLNVTGTTINPGNETSADYDHGFNLQTTVSGLGSNQIPRPARRSKQYPLNPVR